MEQAPDCLSLLSHFLRANMLAQTAARADPASFVSATARTLLLALEALIARPILADCSPAAGGAQLKAAAATKISKHARLIVQVKKEQLGVLPCRVRVVVQNTARGEACS